MKLRTVMLAASLGLTLVAAALGGASSTGAAPKPGFPPGTWLGTGVLAETTETVADLTIRTTGSAKFTLNVSRDHKVSGTGTWIRTQFGSGPVGSKITGVTKVTFSGTPTDVRFKGTQVITTRFKDAAHPDREHSFTNEKPAAGSLVIKKATSCRVTGGHKFEAGTFSWKAALKGVTCRS
jgi:hypothetical protein